jgi:subtilase family serine protease
VADIEGMLQVHLGLYQHPKENRRFFAPDVEPTVEAGLPILYVSGLDNYVIPRPSGFRSTPLPNVDNGSSGPGTYFGSDFRHAYVPGTTLNGNGQVVGLVEFEGYYTNDIALYEATSGVPNVPIQNVTPDGIFTLGTNSDTGECSLDIEMVIAMAPGLAQLTVYEGNNVNDVLNALVNTNNGQPLPNQISCSFSISGANLVPIFLQMAAQGQSFFYAAGDYGAYPTATNAGNIIQNYLTTVGGTELSMYGKGSSYDYETVWNNGVAPSTNGTLANDESAGGILINVPIPEYQQNVSMSLNQGSTQWRNIPDVAMCADQIYIVDDNGGVGRAGGTSAAAPLWAGFTALVNQQAVAQGKPPVGFLNPALYEIGQGQSYSSCFNDITNGNNTNAYSPNLYYATKGYDLCTGWGTPAGTNLINALVGLSGPIFVDFNYTNTPQTGTYDKPFNTLAKGTNAVSPGGTIFIITGGSSSEIMNISKPMEIVAEDGTATIGK